MKQDVLHREMDHVGIGVEELIWETNEYNLLARIIENNLRFCKVSSNSLVCTDPSKISLRSSSVHQMATQSLDAQRRLIAKSSKAPCGR